MKVNENGKFIDSIKITPNMKFGFLTIVGYSKKRDRSKVRYYVCKCECGKIKDISRSALISKDTKSCGCFNIKSKQLKPGMATWNNLFYISKRSALKRNLDFELTIDEFMSLCKQDCTYCGSKPIIKFRYKDHRKERSAIFANGIDRKDSNIGYTKYNCTPCCSICNEMKMDRTVNSFISHVSLIFNFQENK